MYFLLIGHSMVFFLLFSISNSDFGYTVQVKVFMMIMGSGNWVFTGVRARKFEKLPMTVRSTGFHWSVKTSAVADASVSINNSIPNGTGCKLSHELLGRLRDMDWHMSLTGQSAATYSGASHWDLGIIISSIITHAHILLINHWLFWTTLSHSPKITT